MIGKDESEVMKELTKFSLSFEMSMIYVCPESKFINHLKTTKQLHGLEPGINLSIESSLCKFFSTEIL